MGACSGVLARVAALHLSFQPRTVEQPVVIGGDAVLAEE
jgi:hypothetical protein